MIADHYEMLRKNKIGFWWYFSRRELFKSILKKYFPKKLDFGVDIGCGPLTNESLYEDFVKNWISLDHSKKSFEGITINNFSKSIIADVYLLPFFFFPILLIRKILKIIPKGKSVLEINLSPKIFDIPFSNSIWNKRVCAFEKK